MNEKQKQFLAELVELLDKHNIAIVDRGEQGIMFISNGDKLAFSRYEKGAFYYVKTETRLYEPSEQHHD